MPPITDAVLWAGEPALQSNRIFGMTVLERQLFTLAAAGVRRVWVAGPRPQGEGRHPVTQGHEHAWTEREDPPLQCRQPNTPDTPRQLVRKE
ncbi:MAG: hypothetical protein HY553_08370, partial [Elusimicrobia bacterium]|nr:hypothetical protein [Elusimicrobiota bacterium]